ncbi:MAG: M48 family metallopeptidase [Candidatus Bilamarchaeaceae archaeon]
METTDDSRVEYAIAYRKIRYPRLEFKTGRLLLVLPDDYKDKDELIRKHKEWIARKSTIISRMLRQAKGKKLVKREENEFRKLVNREIEAGRKHGLRINMVFFRKMNSKWGSHSRNGNLTFNSLMKDLPEKTIRYIVFHEMAHSVEKKHNARFWKIIRNKFPEYQKIEKDLFVYWFLLQKSRV